MNLVIDIGNTRGKVAVFEANTLIDVFVFDKEKILSEVKKISKKFNIDDILVSSVAFLDAKEQEKFQQVANFILLSSSTKVPFINLYESPDTLGSDRIALVANAVCKYPNKNVLIIDAGTCITFDFVTKEKQYLGGAISLGLKMRFKGLHKFTDKLPLIDDLKLDNFIGTSTEKSIQSGVINGVIKEIDGVILDYKNKFRDLTVVLTGGDTNFLSKQLKSSIFANQNFLLEGLNEILIFNNLE